MKQAELDVANANFWNEICGTTLANRIRRPSIQRFDREYLRIYPWLTGMISDLVQRGQHVLEVGPGYGTVGRLIVARRADYWALDIAPNVVAHTIQHTGRNAILGSVLELDQHFGPEAFDAVVAIGSLHHTGNLPLALKQIHRVLRPGGRLLAMIYGDGDVHDYNTAGAQAPYTDITPPDAIPALFHLYSEVEIVPYTPHRHTDIYVGARK